MRYAKKPSPQKATENSHSPSGANAVRTLPAVPVLQKVDPEEEVLPQLTLANTPLQKTPKVDVKDSLKSGLEHLSGYSLDEVKMHYNPDKPLQLNALAYTQGTNIRVPPGHEQYLPHESSGTVQMLTNEQLRLLDIYADDRAKKAKIAEKKLEEFRDKVTNIKKKFKDQEEHEAFNKAKKEISELIKDDKPHFGKSGKGAKEGKTKKRSKSEQDKIKKIDADRKKELDELIKEINERESHVKGEVSEKYIGGGHIYKDMKDKHGSDLKIYGEPKSNDPWKGHWGSMTHKKKKKFSTFFPLTWTFETLKQKVHEQKPKKQGIFITLDKEMKIVMKGHDNKATIYPDIGEEEKTDESKLKESKVFEEKIVSEQCTRIGEEVHSKLKGLKNTYKVQIDFAKIVEKFEYDLKGNAEIKDITSPLKEYLTRNMINIAGINPNVVIKEKNEKKDGKKDEKKQ